MFRPTSSINLKPITRQPVKTTSEKIIKYLKKQKQNLNERPNMYLKKKMNS